MKSLLLVILVGVVTLLQAEVYGQAPRTTLYHENFIGTINSITHNWQTGTTTNSTASYTKASKGAHLKTGTAPGTYVLELGTFTTGGFEDIDVSWGGKKDGENAIMLEYSYNGGIWVTVDKWFDVGTEWSKVNAELGISLPTCFNKGSVKLRWTFVVTNASTAYAMDDITITGIPYGGPGLPAAMSKFSWDTKTGGEVPYNAARYGSNNFYEADGVHMQWNKQEVGTANMYTQQVTPDYQNIHAYSISQQYAGGVASNNYSLNTLHFKNTAVQGLTFSLFDIDMNKNQFLDILKVVAYRTGSTTPILPQKKHSKTTATNERIQDGNAVFFRSKTFDTGGASIDGSSEEGDVTITFLEPVDRVEFTFYNGIPPQNGKGQQGFAISDLTWRNVNMPAPPVDFSTPSTIGGGSNGPDPLPISLTAFGVKKVAEGAKLDWITANEKDNDRFVVERSLDGKTFEAIGEVKGAGNSNVLLKYSFTDRSPKQGVNYYRLTQVDYDGKFERSKTVYLAVKAGTQASTLATYPNPTPDALTIKLGAALQNDKTFYILSAAGKLVKTVVLPRNETSVQVSVRELAAGLYLVKSDQSMSKFFKQ
ncbi:T9SS type A sorting domain-containing protein [Rufibacter hautae]|uniref:T9SS type A sorting domain-containing protein n=1 Tax=Rufibacter hautae TaxID=2595005 RepID=A0A5B6TTB2_9BACT|nr:T9SS type A sorting domain-containing protein [Rufibacter hautae]KAA3439758.1 T9SS type A sorting domain-containing protein [Rufibacter hautae]